MMSSGARRNKKTKKRKVRCVSCVKKALLSDRAERCAKVRG